MSSGRSTISACVVCRNDADRLEECLRSVGWADEVIVMDLSSSDGSAEVAARQATRVLTNPVVPIVELVRNEVASAATGEWILVLDPDERVTPGLRAELEQLSQRSDIDAVVIPRTNHDFGFAPTDPLHRYEPQLRMYRRRAVEWPRIPNALPQVPPARVHKLPAGDDVVILHDRNRSVAEALDRVIRYAPAQAQSMLERGETFSARRMVTAMVGHVYTQFVRGRAYRDGVPGLLRAGVLVSFYFYVWASLWQLSGVGRTPDDDRFVRRLGIPLRLFGVGVRARRALSRLRFRARR